MEITNVKFDMLKDQVWRERVIKAELSTFLECVGVGLGLGMAAFASWLFLVIVS